MRWVNPLSAPLAVLAASLLFLAGLRLLDLPIWIALPVAIVVAFGLAPFLQAKPSATNPELARELEAAKQRAQELSTKADSFYAEATKLLTAPGQVEALGIVQYARSRVQDLPTRVAQLADRFEGSGSLLALDDLRQQLQGVEAKASKSSGVARTQFVQLADSLRRNIRLAQEGQDARIAQVTSLNTLILDTAGTLQAMQNRLRTADLPQVKELQSLDEQLSAFSEGVDLLVGDPGLAPVPRQNQDRRSFLTSLGIAGAAVALTFVPIPGTQRTFVVVSGTELQEPLQALKIQFEKSHPELHLDLQFQGSQDIVNKFIDDKNDFNPAVIIPANGQILKDLETRWRAQNNSDPFYDSPKPIAKTLLVAIAWPERGKVLFPDGRFHWDRLEFALKAKNWASIGGSASWGSFDFVTTDPTRSNSGQLTLGLFAQDKSDSQSKSSPLSVATLNDQSISDLIALVKRSVYQPPRSTDILLQEFIARGPNDADVATVYESIALYRWSQSATTQGKPYQIYYLDPTVETVSTAAIVRRNIDERTAQSARTFLDFLAQSEQQATFVRYGFRPANGDVPNVPDSPWQKNIPGAEPKLNVQTLPIFEPEILAEIKRLWERSN
jgi:ABC-type molybdate transport system substrate-binding protein